MTITEIMGRIWTALGEPSHLDPATDVSYNGGPLLLWYANEGQREIAKWKDPQTGKPVRIHDLFSSCMYKSCVLTATITAVNNSTSPYSITVDTIGTEADRYNEWMVEVTSGSADGEMKFIVDSTTGILYLQEAFTTAPSVGDTVALYKRFDMILPSTHTWVSEHFSMPAVSDTSRNTGNLLEVLSIIDLVQKIELQPCDDHEKFPGGILDIGSPTSWYRYGNAIYYDKNINTDDYWLRMEYYRMPQDMDLVTYTTPDIPEIFHMAIVMWGVWYGYKTSMESSKAYSTRLDLEAMMKRTATQFDMRKERTNLGGIVLQG